MPKRCSVAVRRSNYEVEKEYVTAFAISKVEPLPTDFSMLKNRVVCVEHFEESSVIRTDTVLVNGNIQFFQGKFQS